MTKTLTFDTATRTGWACGDTTGPRQFGAFVVSRPSPNILAPGIITFAVCAGGLMDQLRPGLVGVESPVLNKKRDNPLKNRWLYGLALMVEIEAHKRGIPCVEEAASTVRTHFLGVGYPKKSAKVNLLIKVKCREMGWDVPHNETDEANALALLDFLLSLEEPALALKSTSLFKGVA